MIQLCPVCQRPRDVTVRVAEWRGLRVDWDALAVTWNGSTLPAPSAMRLRFLYLLVEAGGEPIRRTALLNICRIDSDIRAVIVHITELRNWLRIVRLPFTIVLDQQWQGYRLLAAAD